MKRVTGIGGIFFSEVRPPGAPTIRTFVAVRNRPLI
jgi:hypothetical protein